MSAPVFDRTEDWEDEKYDNLVNDILNYLTKHKELQIVLLMNKFPRNGNRFWKAIEEIKFNQLVVEKIMDEQDRKKNILIIRELSDFHFDDDI